MPDPTPAVPSAPGVTAPDLVPATAPEARQRWRLVVARDAEAPARTQRELAEDWEAAILGAGLPVARTGDARSRPRISFGAPLPVGMAAEADLIDVVLTERWPAWRLREALVPVLPSGWRVVDAHDVWLAGPALAGRVAAADHRVVLSESDGSDGSDGSNGPGSDGGPVEGYRIQAAADELLAARAIVRERPRGGATVSYDLRPLLLDVAVVDAGPPPVLGVRTRLHPELGTGRPEEVVAALADHLGVALAVESIVRLRLLLVDDLDDV